MKIQKFIFLLLILPTMAFTSAHKFYLSVTEVNYASEQKSLQITTRIFVDDFQNLLQKRYSKNLALIKGENNPRVNKYITRYFSEKLKFSIENQELKMNFIGKRYEDDLIICYFEIPNVKEFKTISVSNSLLLDLFEEQKNLVHITKGSETKSKMLLKDNTEGSISF